MLGLCNLLKGIPSLKEVVTDVRREIDNCNLYNTSTKSTKIYAMCHVQDKEDGLYYWRITFCKIRKMKIEMSERIKFSGSLLMLGVLQIEKEDEDFFEIIKEEINILKELKKNCPEDFEKANLGFTLEELEAEFNNRCEQARNRVQIDIHG